MSRRVGLEHFLGSILSLTRGRLACAAECPAGYYCLAGATDGTSNSMCVLEKAPCARCRVSLVVTCTIVVISVPCRLLLPRWHFERDTESCVSVCAAPFSVDPFADNLSTRAQSARPATFVRLGRLLAPPTVRQIHLWRGWPLCELTAALYSVSGGSILSGGDHQRRRCSWYVVCALFGLSPALPSRPTRVGPLLSMPAGNVELEHGPDFGGRMYGYVLHELALPAFP
jgi:hypothetical protein